MIFAGKEKEYEGTLDLLKIYIYEFYSIHDAVKKCLPLLMQDCSHLLKPMDKLKLQGIEDMYDYICYEAFYSK